MSLTDDEVESEDFQGVGENTFQRIKNKESKIGYADGVNDGKESVFQNGFDQGYKDGLRTSFEISKFCHFLQNLKMEKLTDHCLEIEKEEYDKLQIKESKSADHFQYAKHKEKTLDSISQMQHEYVNEITEQCERKMPKVSALLKTQQSA